jgi:hypothetical protein
MVSKSKLHVKQACKLKPQKGEKIGRDELARTDATVTFK